MIMNMNHAKCLWQSLGRSGGGVSLGGQNTKPPTPSDMGFVFFNYSRYLSETKMT